MDFGLGYGSQNAVIQGGYWTNPGTHELGHWFTLPHTFRVGSAAGAGICEWGDAVNPSQHGDGFTDTLIDHVDCNISLDDSAGFNYKKANGTPKLYSELTVAEKTVAQTWFRDQYAKEFYNTTYAALTASQKLRIPVFDTSAPAPVAADGDRLARHLYGIPFANLTTDEQAGITSAIASPDAQWWIKTARYSLWYCKVDDDLIAHHDFGKFYDQLNAGEIEQVRLLNANIMAYRAGKGSQYGIFSEQQLDRICDVLSQTTDGRSRVAVRGSTSGKYIFFGGSMTLASAPLGSSLRPRPDIANAHNAVGTYTAPQTDVIIGRPGTYAVPGPNGTTLRLNRPCSIRATNGGAFSIVGH
jgi:hypothetical protein